MQTEASLATGVEKPTDRFVFDVLGDNMPSSSASLAPAPLNPIDEQGVDDRAVARSLVHRRSIAEVFVTGVHAEAQFEVVDAQWPRANRFHLSADATYYDELLVAETFRQAAIGTSHVVDAVPSSHHFVMTRALLDLVPESLRVASSPSHVRLELRRAVAGRRVHVDARIIFNGSPAGRAQGDLLVLEPRSYDRFRRAGAPGPTAAIRASDFEPEQVGRHFAQDVLLTSAPGRADACLLRIDRTHPVHFDHPQDHVPGMAIIDAARQATWLRLPGRRVAGVDVSFVRFVELDSPCLVESTTNRGRGTYEVTTDFIQNGSVRAVARISLLAT